MQYQANTVDEYIQQIPAHQQEAMQHLRQTILDNLPPGFEETISYKMPAYVVPKSIYPAGYHCKPFPPLPFVNIASQKNFIALYHMGLYADKNIMDWFQKEFPKHTTAKLDMGKSCVRFKKMEDIPYQLIGELMTKMTVDEYIALYEKNYKTNK